jgi:hypothetical protein
LIVLDLSKVQILPSLPFTVARTVCARNNRNLSLQNPFAFPDRRSAIPLMTRQ